MQETNKQLRRVCITRAGYAVIPANSDEKALEKAKTLNVSDFDWEPVNANMIAGSATVVGAWSDTDGG